LVSPRDIQRRTTGAVTLHAAAAWRTEGTAEGCHYAVVHTGLIVLILLAAALFLFYWATAERPKPTPSERKMSTLVE
jgi:hypothetical protein